VSTVDVLAVMDAAAHSLAICCPEADDARHNEMVAARAAVAELIAAHERLAVAARNVAGHVPSVEGALRQSDAALGRVGGGK